MRICLMCDLHLGFDRNALQYDVLEWAIKNIYDQKPDCIIFAGDVTCDGNAQVYEWFIDKMQRINIPFFYIPGNSDLRCESTRERIHSNASNCRNIIDGITVYAVNDSDMSISDAVFEEIQNADKDSIVFMHHPVDAYTGETGEKLSCWRSTHADTMLFYGHCHKSECDNSYVSLQAMDPDKAVGENPCITYYSTDTRTFSKEYYNTRIPDSIFSFLGISCYNALKQIDFAINNKLKNIELRPNCADVDFALLQQAVENWRSSGGENLSVHLPDVGYCDGQVEASDSFDKLISIARKLKADRLTLHVPKISVDTAINDENALAEICKFLTERFNSMDGDLVVGVENMHMTHGESADNSRRFGYIPEECVEFMQRLAKLCRHKVGINFDIGHARNNMPFSQKYQIATWLSQVGEYAVGYHIHQVNYEDGVFYNHMPITEVYGHLISFASFFKCWEDGLINKAPVIFEMRPEDAYEITLNTFNKNRCN